jgi:Family of unknown function (DUF6529)
MESAAQPPVAPAKLLIPALVGAAVAIGLGVYGNEHTPSGESILDDGLFFSATLSMKAWFATMALGLAFFQVLSALRMYGRIGTGPAPEWLGTAHRLSGTLAFLVSLPVAYHCLWALGFQDGTTRVLIHSLAGCFFYGAFAAKVVVVESRRLPGSALPVAGGTVFTAFVVIWLTSALWFFDNIGFPEF